MVLRERWHRAAHHLHDPRLRRHRHHHRHAAVHALHPLRPRALRPLATQAQQAVAAAAHAPRQDLRVRPALHLGRPHMGTAQPLGAAPRCCHAGRQLLVTALRRRLLVRDARHTCTGA
eukprot:scaffold113414_cov68-Phaeocystis_antarctica.AAC.3